MLNAFQWNCLNLVDKCNIVLILIFKCDVTKFRIPYPLVTLCRPPPPLNVWSNLWMLPKHYLTQTQLAINWRYWLSKILGNPILSWFDKTHTVCTITSWKMLSVTYGKLIVKLNNWHYLPMSWDSLVAVSKTLVLPGTRYKATAFVEIIAR